MKASINFSLYPRVVAVHEELCLGATLAGADGRRVELVEDAALALRLGVESVASARLGKLFEPLAGLVPDAEQGVIGVVRATWETLFVCLFCCPSSD